MQKKGITTVIFIFLLSLLFLSCTKNKDNTIIIWTNKTDVVSYAELFNILQSDVNAVVVYKKELISPLRFTKKSDTPDVIIGSWLLSEDVNKHFSSISLTDETKQTLYPTLLELGKKNKTQYLLPISFNLPAVIFDSNNSELIPDNHILSYEQIKTVSEKFNSFNKDKSFKTMGFAPQWNPDFLYLMMKDNGADFNIQDGKLVYNKEIFSSTMQYLENWTNTINNSVYDESDFAFKYLYTPSYKQITFNRSLFAYTTSKDFMRLSSEQLDKIDFRWVCNNSKICIEDDMVMGGVYKKSNKKTEAKNFLLWFITSDAQSKMLEREVSMDFCIDSFGIASGFSSIVEVNERFFPLYYKLLLANVPVSEYLKKPQHCSLELELAKREILLPYIKDTLNKSRSAETLENRFTEWYKPN